VLPDSSLSPTSTRIPFPATSVVKTRHVTPLIKRSEKTALLSLSSCSGRRASVRQAAVERPNPDSLAAARSWDCQDMRESESWMDLPLLLVTTRNHPSRLFQRESRTFSTSCLVRRRIQPMANSQIKLVAATRMMKSLVLRELMMRLPSSVPKPRTFRSRACKFCAQ